MRGREEERGAVMRLNAKNTGSERKKILVQNISRFRPLKSSANNLGANSHSFDNQHEDFRTSRTSY